MAKVKLTLTENQALVLALVLAKVQDDGEYPKDSNADTAITAFLAAHTVAEEKLTLQKIKKAGNNIRV